VHHNERSTFTTGDQAKLIAKFRGIPLAELLSDLLEIPVARAYGQMLRDIEEGAGD